MSNPYDLFETDKEVEKEGVILDYGDFSIRVKRAGGSNSAFNRLFEKLSKPYRRAAQNGSLDESISNKILAQVYAKTVIIGWENVKDRDGNLMEFTVENCEKLLTDLPALLLDIHSQASDFNLFKNEIREEEAKNSESS